MGNLKNVPGESGYMNLTVTERMTIQHVERFGASISLVGVILIFIAYGLFSRVRTIPNTFILFASIANVGASVACLIGYAGIVAGDSSALCQVQAFLLEMFMQSDPWWSFAMAVNVYMVFFMAYQPRYKHMWLYCLLCFGLPSLPALVCLFYAPGGRPIYGNATLWCWIADSHNQLRIFTYYLPIWMCTVLSAAVYVAVGCHVFHQRNQLRNLTLSNEGNDTSATALRRSSEMSQDHGSYGTATTVVHVTAELSDNETNSPSTPRAFIPPVPLKIKPVPPLHPWISHNEYGDVEKQISPTSKAAPTASPFNTALSTSITSAGGHETNSHQATGENNASRKTSIPKSRFVPSNSSVAWWHKFTAKLSNLDPVKLAYLRTSFVFAISILVTWTPSSINRVYALLYPARTSYTLNLASAVVLPLQGLWNGIIFAATTWSVLKEESWEFALRWVPGLGRAAAKRRLREDRASGVRYRGNWTVGSPDGGGVLGHGNSMRRCGSPEISGLTRVGTNQRSVGGNVRVFRGGSL